MRRAASLVSVDHPEQRGAARASRLVAVAHSTRAYAALPTRDAALAFFHHAVCAAHLAFARAAWAEAAMLALAAHGSSRSAVAAVCTLARAAAAACRRRLPRHSCRAAPPLIFGTTNNPSRPGVYDIPSAPHRCHRQPKPGLTTLRPTSRAGNTSPASSHQPSRLRSAPRRDVNCDMLNLFADLLNRHFKRTFCDVATAIVAGIEMSTLSSTRPSATLAGFLGGVRSSSRVLQVACPSPL